MKKLFKVTFVLEEESVARFADNVDAVNEIHDNLECAYPELDAVRVEVHEVEESKVAERTIAILADHE